MSKIIIKNAHEIELMREAGRITAGARSLAKAMVAPGVTTGEIDAEVHKFIRGHGAEPTFLGYGGFPASICISVNDEVIHGIPGERVLQSGDIVSVDVGAKIHGFTGDCAGTFPCGEASEKANHLIEVTKQSFFEGIKFARPGYRVSDIGHAVQAFVESYGFSVVRAYVGHGVGEKLHEPPEIPNYGRPGHGPRLAPGMTLAIEPMVNAGGWGIRVLGNDWTVVTLDGSLSAHYENTVLITEGETEILTLADDM